MLQKYSQPLHLAVPQVGLHQAECLENVSGVKLHGGAGVCTCKEGFREASRFVISK